MKKYKCLHQNEKNQRNNNSRLVLGLKGPNVILVSLDESGIATKNVIFENKDFSVIPQNQNILLEKNTLLMYLKKGKLEKLGTIIFE